MKTVALTNLPWPPASRSLLLLIRATIGIAALLSQAKGQEVAFIGGVWSGGVTSSSVTVVARLNAPGQRVRLVVSENDRLTSPSFSTAVNTGAGSGNTAKLNMQGLRPDTEYHYGIEIAGALRTEAVSRGRFRTFPAGRASFCIAFGSCGDFRSADQRVYRAVMEERPLLFINLGDLHYSDTNSTNPDDYRVNYDNVLAHSVQGALYRSVPVAYMWDDHDYCGNDTDMTAQGRAAALATYKERVPHYPLAQTAGGTLAQSFTIGRVRFIMTDLHSAATPSAARESASKTRMGAAQKTWFKQELISARDNGFPLIVWVNPDPWIAPAQVGTDSWGAHATERTELANFIRDNRISNLVLLSGDMHALAFDDGSNSDFATGGGAPVTVLHAAAFTSEGSMKGGPYSGGVFPGGQQYGVLEVFDNGGPSVACRFLGKKLGEPDKLTHIFSASAGGARSAALVNISTLARITHADDAVASGFVISSVARRNVLVRAVGPSLAAFGVADALRQPELLVYQSDQIIAQNSSWSSGGSETRQLTEAFDSAGAFRLIDEASSDAALILSLPAGSYTARVKSADRATGSVLLEVYELP